MWSPNTLASFQLAAYFSFQQNLTLLIIFLSCKALSWRLRHSYVLFFQLCFCLLFLFLLVSSLLLEFSKGTAIFSHFTWSSWVISCSSGVSNTVFVSLKYWFFNPFLNFGCIIGLTITLQVSYHPFKTCFLLLLFDFFFFFLVSVISNHIYPIAQARNLGVIFSFSPFLTTYIKVDPFRLLRFHTCLSIATIAIPSQIHFIFLLGIFLGIFLTGLTSESNLSLFLYILYIAARVIFLNDGFDHITSILKKSSHILMTWGLPT